MNMHARAINMHARAIYNVGLYHNTGSSIAKGLKTPGKSHPAGLDDLD